MTTNYVNPVPRDRGGAELHEFPAPVRAQVTTMRENAVASSALAIGPNTSSLEVYAFGGQGIAIRWVAVTETPSVAPRASVVASGLGANFDHVIPSGQVRRFAVPRETQGLGTGTLQIGSTIGLYQRIAAVNAGIVPSSVLFVEY